MQRWAGTALLAGSAVAYSLAGYFTRLIPLDVMTLLFWRGIFGGIMITILVIVQFRAGAWDRTRAIGWQGLGVAAMGVLSSYLYLAAFRHTTVADVAIIYATLPFVTAAIAWVLLREREGWRVMASSVVALGGVAIMTGGAVHAGHLVGDLLAFAMTLSFAITMVLMRRGGRQVSMMPAVAIMCFLTALAAAPFARTGPLDSLPLLHLVLFGTCQLGLGLVFLTLGMRRVGATRAALIGLIDTPLAPLWVWLAFNEVPPLLTLAGGAVVMAAVLWNMAGPAQAAEAAG
ncbi:MAG: DMT family transporter [Proteobacteria bacterium]|nr:DMT family transporter [Pseudomonadota bacterium]